MAGITWATTPTTVTGLGDQGGTQNSPTAWDTVDADAAAHFNGTMTSAAAVLVLIRVTATNAVGLRKTGSTDVFYRDHLTSQTYAWVGVDGSNQFDIATETAANTTVLIVAWCGDDICFMNTNAQSTGVVGTVDVYENETVTSQAGDTAVVAMFMWDGGGAANYTIHAKHADIADGTYDRFETVHKSGYDSTGLNASEAFKWRASSTSPQIRIMGYFFGATVTAHTTINDRNVSLTDNTYGDITTQSFETIGMQVMNTSGVGQAHSWACRDNTFVWDEVGNQNRERSFICVEKVGTIELKLGDVSDQECHEIWGLDNPTAGANPKGVLGGRVLGGPTRGPFG